MYKEDVSLEPYTNRKPPSTPKPKVSLPQQNLTADEVQWLTEQYIDRYGLEREYFGDMVVVNMPKTKCSESAMIVFHKPISLTTLCNEVTPIAMLEKLVANKRNDKLPERFKVCFMTHNSDASVHPFWLNIIYDFNQLTDRSDLNKLYETFHITIMDPREDHNFEVKQIASNIDYAVTKLKQIPVPFCDSWPSGDHAARNGVHFSLFEHTLGKIDSIRNSFVKWCSTPVPFGKVEGLNYRLRHLQADNPVLIARANQEMLLLVDSYIQFLSNERSERMGALLEIRSTLETGQSLSEVRSALESRFPKMYDSLDPKNSFMLQLMEALVKLQSCCVMVTPKSEDTERSVTFFN